MGLSSWRGVNLARDGGRLLYIGLGAGAAPAFAAKKFATSDVRAVEIDPMIIDVVRAHHGLEFDVVRALSDDDACGDGRLRVVLGDCATTMKTCAPKSLDVVFMDAFDGDGEIPGHLIEDEFLRSCADALTDGGSLVLNMFNGVRGSPAREAVVAFATKLARVVGPVCSFPVTASPVNVVLSATKRKHGESDRPTREEISRAAAKVGEQCGFEWSAKRLVEGAFWVELDGGDAKEVVAGEPGGILGKLGKFKGRHGTIMPREFLVTLDDEDE
jgi:spermidine synthase